MDAATLRKRARQELDELGPEPASLYDRTVWTEERRGVVELLAALADWDVHLLRRAAVQLAERTDRGAAELLVDAAACTRSP